MLNECLSLVLLHPRGVEFNKVGDLLFRASGSERRQVKQLHQIGPSCIIIWTARWPVTMKNQLTDISKTQPTQSFPFARLHWLCYHRHCKSTPSEALAAPTAGASLLSRNSGMSRWASAS